MKATKPKRRTRQRARIVPLLAFETAVPLTCPRCGGALVLGRITYTGDRDEPPIARAEFECLPCEALMKVCVDTDRVTFTLTTDEDV